jgi:hypothetical protein
MGDITIDGKVPMKIFFGIQDFLKWFFLLFEAHQLEYIRIPEQIQRFERRSK